MSSTIYINNDDIVRLLDRIIHPDVHNRAEITDYLAYLIRNKYGEGAMFARVMLDIVPKPTYDVGDIVYVHRDRIYIGTYDFDKTLAAGFILAEDTNYIKAEVVEVNRFQDSCYLIKIQRVQSDNSVDSYKTNTVENHIYHEKVIPAPGRLNVGDII